MSASQFQRIVTFSPAFDRRNPDPKKNYGVHGVDLWMALKGPLGAVQFVVYTNWMLPHVQEETDSRPISNEFPFLFHKPLPSDVGYHSPKPLYEGQTPMKGECDHVDGGVCYYDGSSLAAKEMFRVLTERGSDGVWEELEKRYNETFSVIQEAA